MAKQLLEEHSMKKPLHMLTGVNIGDYEFEPDTILDVIKKYKFGKENGGVFTYVALRMDQKSPTSEQLYSWAKYLADNEVYFSINDSYPRIGEMRCYRSKEDMEKVAEIAGEYYIGEEIGEFSGWYSSKAKGYESCRRSENPVRGLKTCFEAKETYMRQLRKISDKMRENGSKTVITLQADAMTNYDFDAGIDHTVIETYPRNIEHLVSFGRGAARANKKDVLGAWIAHEFYAGYDQFDPLKAKRFTLEYYMTYLAGIDYCCLESGYRGLYSHVDEPLPADHPLAKSYLKEAEDFARFCNKDIRPGKNGPITKIAFVKGNLDGYAYGNSSSLWGQYEDKKWGFAAPEFSYRILDEVHKSADWTDIENCGDHDYSGSPAYGQYDVIPATCPLEVMKRYEWVIFCGWNTMTPEIVETLKAYVAGGGKIFITAAHIRDSIDRAEKGNFADGLEELLGVKLSNFVFNSNEGYKFVKESSIDGVRYPGTKGLMCDPSWSSGYTDYVKITPTSANPVCYLSDTFGWPKNKDGEVDNDNLFATGIFDMSLVPIITENKYGDGYAVFMASSEYPGAPEIYPLYKIMVKEILSASHRTSDLKVIGSDKIRFAMFEDEEKYKLYLLNSDYNKRQFVTVIFRGEEREVLIDSVGLEIIEYKK